MFSFSRFPGMRFSMIVRGKFINFQRKNQNFPLFLLTLPHIFVFHPLQKSENDTNTTQKTTQQRDATHESRRATNQTKEQLAKDGARFWKFNCAEKLFVCYDFLPLLILLICCKVVAAPAPLHQSHHLPYFRCSPSILLPSSL